MRVCPCCGYQDPRYWKHAKWSYHIDTCSWETFKTEYPELAKNLQKGGPCSITEDKDFVYRITKTMMAVQRKAKADFGHFTTIKDLDFQHDGEEYERFNHLYLKKKSLLKSAESPTLWQRFHPNQTRLMEKKQ